MQVRDINAVVRACDGRNVYITTRCHGRHRVTRARTHQGRMQVYLLHTGEWLTVVPELSSFEVC